MHVLTIKYEADDFSQPCCHKTCGCSVIMHADLYMYMLQSDVESAVHMRCMMLLISMFFCDNRMVK